MKDLRNSFNSPTGSLAFRECMPNAKAAAFKVLAPLAAVCFFIVLVSCGLAAPGGTGAETQPDQKAEVPGRKGFATADFGTVFIFHPAMKDFDSSVGAFIRKAPASIGGDEREALLERRRKDLSDALGRHRKFVETIDKQRAGLKALEDGARKDLERDLLEARRIYGLETRGKDPHGPVVDVGASGATRRKPGSAADGGEDALPAETAAAGSFSSRVKAANDKYAATLERIRNDLARIAEEETRSRWDMLSVVYTGPEETARRFREIREEILEVVEEVRVSDGHLVVFNTTPSYQEGFMDSRSGTSLAKSLAFFSSFEKKVSEWLSSDSGGGKERKNASKDGRGESGPKGSAIGMIEKNLYSVFLETGITDPGVHGPTVEIGTMLWNWFYGLSDARHLVAGQTGTGSILAGGSDITAEVIDRLLSRYRIPREKRELVIKSLDALP